MAGDCPVRESLVLYVREGKNKYALYLEGSLRDDGWWRGQENIRSSGKSELSYILVTVRAL